ncbi:MAG: CocE/NonD family hydrolase [Psychroserpens sp.]|uniref:CocE/NonD family hydrolase n=1 Tax=Psychroserpens sp. TaxID=2020870 RepID=UPI00300282C0
MKKLLIVLFLILINLKSFGQDITFEKVALSDSIGLAKQMQELAKDCLKKRDIENLTIEPNDLYKIEILAGNYKASINAIQSLRGNSENLIKVHQRYIQFELFSKAKLKQLQLGISFNEAYQSIFKEYLIGCSDEKAYLAIIFFTTHDAVAQFTHRFRNNHNAISKQFITTEEAINLLKSYFLYHVYTITEPIVFKEINQDNSSRYIIKEELIISSIDGAELSLTTVRKKNSKPMPAILEFTIYADVLSNTNDAILAASKGYVGVVATSRGKRQSSNAIEPYKHEYKDVYAVIDWISKQEWSNAKVGMFGGSYNGFSQWASMKEKVHPALKTIVPSVSVAPGIDAPMGNNIFFNFPYKWIPYVMNNKYLDNAANYDRDRWNNLENTWFSSGKSFNKMDSIDGTPNPVFQEWISHPSYDSYWQNMIPYKDEFSHINIPILSTTGYYDDGQRGAMHYYLEHLKYNPKAEHYLLIGPYDHFGAQFGSSDDLRGYQIDDVARINIKQQLIFEWFDYIMKGKEKPAILKNKVNFQVMGANKWLNKSSLSEMSNDSLTFYLSTNKIDRNYTFINTKPPKSGSVELKANFADRTKMNNADYYPWPIIKDSINLNDGLVFISEKLKNEMIISGSFTGELQITINKKDFDFAVNLYELTPEGKYFHLSNYIGRASYAKNREKRELLTPNRLTTISFDNTSIICKKIAKESQIVIVINVNKNSYGQINYGTGRDVSSESIRDASIPLELKVNARSKIKLPLWFDN